MPVPQQLPHIAIGPAWYPDPRKTIFDQQLQDVPSVLAIGFLLAYPLRSDFGRLFSTFVQVKEQREMAFGLSGLRPCLLPSFLGAYSP